MRFGGRVAPVPGASSGMGAATARRLSERGARAFTTQRRAAEYVDITADLGDRGTPVRIMKSVAEAAGRRDILVNNAGLMRAGPGEETSLEDWGIQIAMDLTIPCLLIRHAMPKLRAAAGAIVNVGSIEGIGVNPRDPACGASTPDPHGLTRAVAVDHGADGVRGNAQAPGWIGTAPNTEFIASRDQPEACRTDIEKAHPVGRTGAPVGGARLICWSASDEAAFVSGEVWRSDGGRMTRLSLP